MTRNAPIRLPKLLSVRAIAEATSLPLSSVYDAVSRGELAVVRIGESGRALRVDEADVLRWISSRREQVAK